MPVDAPGFAAVENLFVKFILASEAAPGDFRIEKVEKEPAAGAEHARHLAEDAEILFVAFEVAESGEEARNEIERAVLKGEAAHIETGEAAVALALVDKLEKRKREIATGCLKALFVEGGEMAPGSAGEIEHAGGRVQACRLEGEFHALDGFGGVAVGVALEIIFVESLAEPGWVDLQGSGSLRQNGSPLRDSGG